MSELFVAEAARGAGLGQQLLDAATQAARERHCIRIWLVNNRERPSYVRGFYSRQGRSAKALVRACPKTPKEKTMKVRTTQ